MYQVFPPFLRLPGRGSEIHFYIIMIDHQSYKPGAYLLTVVSEGTKEVKRIVKEEKRPHLRMKLRWAGKEEKRRTGKRVDG